MSELSFSQSERRNFATPAIVVGVLVLIAFALIYFFTPRSIAELAVTHTAVLATHTVFKSNSRVVGAAEDAQDVFYVLATVRVEDKLKLPLFIKDITGTLTTADDQVTTSSAVEKNDLDNLYTTFPALKPLAGAPLLRETAIQPGEHAEGMVLLHFPIDQAAWDQRKSAVVTIDFYHQGPLTVAIPKP
jgi:hypothetical protein